VTSRRAFLAAALPILTAPCAAEAQPVRKAYRIGFLGVSSASDYAANLKAFLLGLRELGYEEGKNVSIEYRWADGRTERLSALAAGSSQS
jgi:putative ABC transport system substrate-binding protein